MTCLPMHRRRVRGLRAALSRTLSLTALLGAFAIAGLAQVDDAAARGKGPVVHEPFLTEFGQKRAKFDAARWWRTHDRVNLNWRHNIGWHRDAIKLLEDRIELSLLDRPYKDRDYTAGSLKTFGRYGFGRFDAIMRPAFAPGSISAFFIYTGKGFGTRHDELDFEFTGRSRTEVSINTFVDGKPATLEPIDLGFNYDEEPHAYGIEWTPDYVRWFVDGKQVAEIRGDHVPSVPGKIVTSIWAAKGLKRWAGEFDPSVLPLRADVYCVSWRPIGDGDETCTDKFLAEPAAWVDGALADQPLVGAN